MTVLRFVKRTPVRTFLLYPLVVIVWELILNRGTLKVDLIYLPLMVWGYLQYRLCGVYRVKRGGGGPGFEVPPERLVSSGPYAYTRNPMYLGHIIFLLGLTLTLRSLLAAVITVACIVWFHYRVLADEKSLVKRWGEPYVHYLSTVKRWVPGLI
ncbi:MAG: isoprenylcysteine carboxylmethyltransferase family protein [Deltaproteobacteria bacterium]|nr:isoprenylcysteine carboxylmethyltransferase family protein [Deltaproteobacteria bacterium]